MPRMRSTKHVVTPRMPFDPAGVAGLIDYNGLTFNDRRYPDQIRVTEITGLDGGDIRDSREPKQDRDGETAFDSNYSGRNLALKGYVQAGDWYTMKSMWDDLQEAFDDPVDQYMSFLWNDVWEDWRGDWKPDYAWDVGSWTQLYSPSQGVLAASATAPQRFHYVQRDYVDGEVLVPFVNGPSGPGSTAVGAIATMQADGSCVTAVYASGVLYLTTINAAGTETVISSAACAAGVATRDYWLRLIFDGSQLTGEVWADEPTDDDSIPPLTRVTGTAPGNLGAGVRGYSGVRFQPAATDAMTLGEAKFEARNPGDAMILCRKTSKIDSSDSIDSQGRYRKDFLITLRSPEPHFVSRKRETYSATPTVGQLIFPGDGSGFTFPGDGTGIVFGAPIDALLTNLGRSPGNPIIRIYGPCVNPGVYVANTGMRVLAGTTIASSNQFIEFDMEAEEITDQNGNDAYDRSSPASDLAQIGRGPNRLYFGADSFTPGTTKVTVSYRHTSR